MLVKSLSHFVIQVSMVNVSLKCFSIDRKFHSEFLEVAKFFVCLELQLIEYSFFFKNNFNASKVFTYKVCHISRQVEWRLIAKFVNFNVGLKLYIMHKIYNFTHCIDEPGILVILNSNGKLIAKSTLRVRTSR